VLDLLITSGSVVSPSDTQVLDVGVKDGKVVLLATPGQAPREAARTIDATGRYVVPGGIDPHVHFDLGLSPAMRAQRASAGSRAAAHGGTTTFIDFALQQDDKSLVKSIETKQIELAAERPEVDYALHAMLTGKIPMEVLEEIPEAISGGVSSFKVFTTFSGESASGTLYTDDGRIWGAMEQTSRHGGLLMAHCEDDCIIDLNVRRLYRAGRQQGENIALARPNLAEEAAIRRLLLLAERSGCPLYVVHVSTREGVRAIGEARAAGSPAYGEVLHNYLAFTSEKYRLADGLLYHNYPPLKSDEDRRALWAGVEGPGALETVASDDFTIPRAAKLSGTVVDNVSGGHNGVETRMNVLFSEGVTTGRMSVNRFVEVTSTNVARLFGLYPRKGAIAPGSDADIVLIDPDARRTYRLEELHSDCDYSLWDGWECQGWITTTISRGRVVVQDGAWVGPGGGGRFVPSGSPGQP
jgi:dihydropyrimidinase